MALTGFNTKHMSIKDEVNEGQKVDQKFGYYMASLTYDDSERFSSIIETAGAQVGQKNWLQPDLYQHWI